MSPIYISNNFHYNGCLFMRRLDLYPLSVGLSPTHVPFWPGSGAFPCFPDIINSFRGTIACTVFTFLSFRWHILMSVLSLEQSQTTKAHCSYIAKEINVCLFAGNLRLWKWPQVNLQLEIGSNNGVICFCQHYINILFSMEYKMHVMTSLELRLMKRFYFFTFFPFVNDRFLNCIR